MGAEELKENETTNFITSPVRQALGKFERSKILEVYFSRLDGRIPEHISGDYEELYEIELSSIKAFLLGQHPQDTLLQKIFRIMN